MTEEGPQADPREASLSTYHSCTSQVTHRCPSTHGVRQPWSNSENHGEQLQNGNNARLYFFLQMLQISHVERELERAKGWGRTTKLAVRSRMAENNLPIRGWHNTKFRETHYTSPNAWGKHWKKEGPRRKRGGKSRLAFVVVVIFTVPQNQSSLSGVLSSTFFASSYNGKK